MKILIETLREQPGVQGLVQLAHSAISRINELERENASLRELLANQLANQPKTSGSPLPQRWAVFCAGCRKEWSVTYEHSGRSLCSECKSKATGGEA